MIEENEQLPARRTPRCEQLSCLHPIPRYPQPICIKKREPERGSNGRPISVAGVNGLFVPTGRGAVILTLDDLLLIIFSNLFSGTRPIREVIISGSLWQGLRWVAFGEPSEQRESLCIIAIAIGCESNYCIVLIWNGAPLHCRGR